MNAARLTGLKKRSGLALAIGVSALGISALGSAGAASWCTATYTTDNTGKIGFFNAATNSVSPLFNGASANINAIAQSATGGTLYYINRANNNVYTLNLNTGTETMSSGALNPAPTTIVGGTTDAAGNYYVYSSAGNYGQVNVNTGAVSGGAYKTFGAPAGYQITSGTNGDFATDQSAQTYVIAEAGTVPNGSGLSAGPFLWKLNLNTGALSAPVPLRSSAPVNAQWTGKANGLMIDPTSGTFYISSSDGPSGGAPGVYTINPATGVTTFKGSAANLTDLGGCPIVPAAPTLSKSFNPTVAGGVSGTTTLSLTLGNSNRAPVYLQRALTDTLPAGMNVAGVPALGGTCNVASNNTAANVITAAAGSGTITLAAGGRVPAGGCTITVNVSVTAQGTYTNSLASAALETTTGINADPATATYTLSPQPVLSVSVVGNVSALMGGQVGYVFTVSNTSATDSADNLTFTPTLPAGLSNVTWACQKLDTVTGTECPVTALGSALPITGLKIAPNSSLRITVQGNATLSGTVTGSGQAVSGAVSSNVASLNTAVAEFPTLCSAAPEQVLRPASNLRSGVNWPLDASNAVTTSVIGTEGGSAGVGTSTLAYQPVTLGAATGQQRGKGTFTYTVTLAKAVPAKQFYFTVQDVNFDNPTVTVTVTGGATPANFTPVIVPAENAGTNLPLIYDSTAATGRLYRQVNTLEASPSAPGNLRGSVHLFGVGDALVKSFSVTGDYRFGDLIAFLYGAQLRCGQLSVTKTTDTPVLRVSDVGGALSYAPAQVGYTITVKNVGGESAAGVTVTDTLPAGLTYASVTGTPALVAGQPTASNPTLTLTLPSLAAGASQVYTVKTTPALTGGVNQSDRVNTATASSTSPGVASVTSAPATTQIVYPKLSKRVSNVTRPAAPMGTGLPGEVLEYCVDALNHGSVALNNFVITDHVPASTTAQPGAYGAGLGVSYVAAGVTQPPRTSAADADGARLTTTGGTYGKGTMTLTVGSLPAGTVSTGCFRVKID